MRSQALKKSPLQRFWSPAFLLTEEAHRRHGSFLESLDPRLSDLLTSRLQQARVVSSGICDGGVRFLGAHDGSAIDPVEVARVIAGHALLARSLIVPMQEPGFWVRATVIGAPRPVARPAFPLEHLRAVTGTEERPLETALAYLVRDGAIEIIRAPNGTRAALLLDGTLDENRFRPFLRA